MLTARFFARDTLHVARGLLGKFLCRRIGKKTIRAMITEVEAYKGFEDKASHAARRKTKRNAPMFGSAGHWYIYLTYGMHWMLNIVTEKGGYPAAILIRKVVLDSGEALEGPAKFTKKIKITDKFNTKRANRKTGLWIEDGGVKIRRSDIKTGPRIGVSYAGPFWSKKNYRFYIYTFTHRPSGGLSYMLK